MSLPTLPLLLDVDTGIDDALALLYVAASTEADLLGVTCLSGNVEAHQVDANTRAVLELAGRDDVEVGLGRTVPLVRPLVVTPETHGPRGLGNAVLPPARRPRSERSAVDLLLETVRARPGEVTLVTLGPLTTLAMALEHEPALPRLLRRWVAMGGAFGAAGNTTPVAEWNVHCDPEAAKLAFAGWARAVDADPTVPRALVLGLDVTERVRFLPADLDALLAAAGPGPVATFVRDALDFYFDFHARFDGFRGAFIHDPLAVAAALDPGLVRVEPVFVDVETTGELTSGMTVADRRGHLGRTPNVDLAVEVDGAAFLARFTQRLVWLARGRGGVAL